MNHATGNTHGHTRRGIGLETAKAFANVRDGVGDGNGHRVRLEAQLVKSLALGQSNGLLFKDLFGGQLPLVVGRRRVWGRRLVVTHRAWAFGLVGVAGIRER